MTKPVRLAVFGAGFWTRYQLAAWRELGGVECVAIYNRSRAKAEALARDLGIPEVYDRAETLLREAKPDFVDNITEVGGHKPLLALRETSRPLHLSETDGGFTERRAGDGGRFSQSQDALVRPRKLALAGVDDGPAKVPSLRRHRHAFLRPIDNGLRLRLLGQSTGPC